MITLIREDILNAFSSFIKTITEGMAPQAKQELYQGLIDKLERLQDISK